jgi:outer membrane protein TolC
MKTFIISLGLLSATLAHAGDTLTFDQAVREGVEKSPTVKKYQSGEEQASWERYGAAGGLLPQISLTANHEFSAQYQTVPVTLGALTAAVPEVAPRTVYGAEANWTIFNGLGNIKHFQASLDLFHAAHEESSREEFEVRKKIELAFFNALAAQRFEEVAKEDVKTLQESMAQVRYRMNSGVSTEYDVLRVQVRLSDATTELERTEDNVIIQRKLLAQAMGLSEDDRKLEGELSTPVLVEKVKSLSAPLPEDRQDFRAAQLRSDAAEKESSAATGALLPSVGLNAQYDRYDNTDYPGQAYGGFRDAWSAGVYARWNILDGGVSVSKSHAAAASAQRAENQYQETVLTLPSDFELWKRRYIYSAHAFDSKNQNLKSSEESFRISGVSFQQGRKTITDVLEAETDLIRARAGVVQAQLDAEEALVKLELTIGKDI